MSIYSDVSMLNGAMRAFQYGLNTTSNNIANVNTPGYSRQVLGLQSVSSILDGSVALGQGVDATSLARVRDIFLDSRIKFELSELGRSTASEEALTELAAIFPEVASAGATNGLNGAIDTLVSDWTALAAAPTSITAKANVLSAARNLADMLNADARATFDLQMRVDDNVKQAITDINSLTDQIASINAQLKATPGSSLTGAPNVLLDMREQAAEKLAKLVDADFRITADGSMSVTLSSADLVQGGTAKHLIAISSPYDPGRTNIGFSAIQGAAARNITTTITGGTLGGLLTVRDQEIESARLSLDRMAFGIISRSNEINDTYVAGDGTTQHDIFNGTRAADIVVNPIVAANADYIGGTRDAANPGDLAKIQAQLKNFIQYSTMRTSPGYTLMAGPALDPTQPIGSQLWFTASPTFTSPSAQGQFVISTGGNAITVNWDQTQSLDQIIANINANGGGAFYATFNKTTQELIIMGDTPMTVYDTAANFMDVFGVGSVVTSSAPINNYPVPGGNQVDPFSAMNNVQNKLNIFSTPDATGGTVLIDNNPVNWAQTDDIGTTIPGAIAAATSAPNKVGLLFDPVTQTVKVFRSGDPLGGNAGVHDYTGLGNVMAAVQIVDKSGNLTRTLNIDTNTNASHIMDEMVSTISSRVAGEAVLQQQAQALVDQTQTLQNNESAVDLNAELAQAKLYQRSYEASVRMQFILDEILNTLINHTGSSAPDSTPV
jgi:flagellar hook-associated protein FlgK